MTSSKDLNSVSTAGLTNDLNKETVSSESNPEYPDKCPKTPEYECPVTGTPEKNGAYCEHYRKETGACLRGTIYKGKVIK